MQKLNLILSVLMLFFTSCEKTSNNDIIIDEDVITLMPKHNKKSVKAVYDHTGLTLEKNNAINDLDNFIKILNSLFRFLTS